MNYVARPKFAPPIAVADLVQGKRRPLAKAITLAESENPAHSVRLSNLLRDIHAQTAVRMIPRIALSGSPGAGKSCLVEALGYYLAEEKQMKVGVLAVDPTSTISGGGILGDKTRMEKLANHPNAYVRPSPSGGHLGGVTARAWEVMEILEAAHFDILIIETVGVGQSETQCKDLTDMMLLLVPPASGDELQGIKKGIVEVADVIVVTKNDGPRTLLAQQTKAHYSRAVMYTEIQQGFAKPVMAVSSEEGKGIAELWAEVEKMWNTRKEKGHIERLRKAQMAKHFMNYYEMELMLKAKRMVGSEMKQYAQRVLNHEMTPREAGDIMVARTLRTHLCSEEDARVQRMK